MKELSDNILPFNEDNFSFVRTLQEAPRNSGRVDHMEMFDGNFVRAVAVKVMPRSWTLQNHCEFRKRCSGQREQPWLDMGIVKELNRRRYHYACKLLGVFETNDRILVVTSLAEQGDLFSWIATKLRKTGLDRESRIHPISVQLCDAVCWLHDLGVAHRDISIENIVLTVSSEALELKLIDFGMAVAARHTQGVGYGKEPYIAPEMHTHCEYDAFLTDAFATAVVLLSMILASYPWQSTRPGSDPKFSKAMLVGMSNCLESMKTCLPGGDVVGLSRVASSAMMELLVGLLALQPSRRQTLGESCYGARNSVWDGPWLRGLRPKHGFRVGDSAATSTSLPML
jgi:serine/threonine protein kinase